MGETMNQRFAVLLHPILATLIAIVLLGCAAKSNELRQKSAEIKFVSLKSSKQIAECIAEKWQYVPFTGPLISRTTPKGYTIIQYANGGVGAPAFVSDINDIPTGTESIFYTYYPFRDSSSYFQDSVKECQ
jgi:hypothetical protein